MDAAGETEYPNSHSAHTHPAVVSKNKLDRTPVLRCYANVPSCVGAYKFDRQGDMAVRLALGETHLVKENKEYFEKEGVDISVLESAKATGGGRGAEERSSTVILVKNLPYSTEAAELAKRFGAFGDVSTTTCMLLWDRAKRISLSSGGVPCAQHAASFFKRMCIVCTPSKCFPNNAASPSFWCGATSSTSTSSRVHPSDA